MTSSDQTGTLPPFISTHPDGVTLALKVQPRAKMTGIDGVHGAELRVKVTAPPVDAAANDSVIRLFAELLGVPRGNVEIIRGQTSRHKVVRIRGVSPADILARI